MTPQMIEAAIHGVEMAERHASEHRRNPVMAVYFVKLFTCTCPPEFKAKQVKVALNAYADRVSEIRHGWARWN